MRSSYWSNSKLASWILPADKPEFATLKEWDHWKQESRSRYPIRYWIAEEGLDYLQDIILYVPNKIYNVKYYINNRWVTRTHSLTAHPRDIKPGTWRDVGDRFLPCLFNELQDYVEKELAWWHVAWDEEARKKFKAPFWASGWFRWRTWRCPEAGLENLNWQASLTWDESEVGKKDKRLGKPTPQAIKAKEILELYYWWTKVYRNRPDPSDASGWSEYCELRREKRGNTFKLLSGLDNEEDLEFKELGTKAMFRCQEIEEEYEKENEEMMIRLIKIRHGLWT